MLVYIYFVESSREFIDGIDFNKRILFGSLSRRSGSAGGIKKIGGYLSVIIFLYLLWVKCYINPRLKKDLRG